ncbi:PfkB family carbohydrate kinase, partial [Streptomyces sp. WAC 05379]|uniref:PfkB family carbohydrate kinase n=1 Tax=Streptomyces sp. WAC 05379 TaxID=2203207 RepID=UPI0037D9D700
MTITGPCNAPDGVDVVALGESMVTFLPSRPGRLADVPSFERAIGGAESNVACGLAAAGHSVRWVSRVGDPRRRRLRHPRRPLGAAVRRAQSGGHPQDPAEAHGGSRGRDR